MEANGQRRRTDRHFEAGSCTRSGRLCVVSLDRLPADVQGMARVYDNGEVAWPRDHAATAIEALGKANCLILGLDFRREAAGRILEYPWSSYEPESPIASGVDDTVSQALDDLHQGLEHDELEKFPWVLVTWDPGD